MTEQIWAPWRIEYILSEKPSGCILCDCVGRGRESLVLARRERAYAMLNRYPYTCGHVMVVPVAHASRLSEVKPEDHIALWDLVRDAATALSEALHPEGMNIGLNLGRCAGAGIDEHLHVHLVPRWNGDTNMMPVLGDVRVMPEYLETTYDRLAPHFARLGEDR